MRLDFEGFFSDYGEVNSRVFDSTPLKVTRLL